MLDFSYMMTILPQIGSALLITVKISFFGLLISLAIGAISSVVLFYRLPFIGHLLQGYVTFFRNTPLLLHLFFLYYGLPRISSLLLSFETTALIGLSLIGGAFMAEAFRSGLEAISKLQQESAYAIGLSRWQAMRYVIFPQALSYTIPALGANAIFLFKETSVFTAIAGTDVTTVAIGLINMDYKTYEVLLMLVGAYALILIPAITLLNLIEKRVRYAEFGH